jgi:Na+/citrate or Na+/malate symporter
MNGIPWIFPIGVPLILSIWQWSVLRQTIKPAASWIRWSIPAYIASFFVGILLGLIVDLTLKDIPLAALIGALSGGFLYGILPGKLLIRLINSSDSFKN